MQHRRAISLSAGMFDVWLLTIVCLAWTASSALAQSSAILTGTVVDETGAVIADATVTVTNEATAARRQVKAGADGSFVFSALAPGRYTVDASRTGFQRTETQNIVLNVDDRLVLRLRLAVAALEEKMTISGAAFGINTSPGTGTVIDRQFVENLPLNGRSFQALLELTPGVVLTPASTRENGQFSVNGQRTSENYFTVDGLSANASTTTASGGLLGASSSGQLPSLTTLGGTSGLVSVDALQEFRIQTSGYAPEFGRVPGGQVSLVTRSGTNVLHGSAFEYFRHNALDASDWFAKRGNQPESKLRQHNFGGVLGGPIVRNRTFAFGSYEHLRLLLPQAKTTPVPSQSVRNTAPPAVRQYLDALPQQNGPDLGGGVGQFLAIYSDPSSLDSTSVRIDQRVNEGLTVFGRWSDAPSSTETRVVSYGYVNAIESRTRSATLVGTWVMSGHSVVDVRANLNTTHAPVNTRQDPIGGAIPLTPTPVSGGDPDRTLVSFQLLQGGLATWGPSVDFPAKQFNVVGSMTHTMKGHEVKVGVDFRRTSTTARGGGGSESILFDISRLSSGRASVLSMSYRNPAERVGVFDNLSLYAQDNWRLSRLTMNYGVRWDVVPAPYVTSGPDPITLDRTDDLYSGRAGLASPGTELWKTRYNALAPRIGATYVVSDREARSLVLKSGVGLFYGLGYGQIANALGWAYPFITSRTLMDVPFPVNSNLIAPPVFGVDPPTQLWVADRDLRQPYTIQWNVSAEHGLGVGRKASVAYVGADGSRLLKIDRYLVNLAESPTTLTTVNVSRNVGYSDYHALQLQFQNRMSRGLQALVSYSLARSRDTGSSDAAINVPADRLPPSVDYGYSSFDVRHVLTGAVTWQLPHAVGPRVWRAAASGWGLDAMMRARSAYPVDVTVNTPFPPDNATVRPNIVPEQPFWINDPAAPGGRRLNRQAFSTPPVQTQGNLQRGIIRGFSLSQVDMAVRREFAVIGRVRLQLRIEAFNVLNTPHFADPRSTLASSDFGVSTQMVGRALGGQNALYQIGGPRSVQIGAKVVF